MHTSDGLFEHFEICLFAVFWEASQCHWMLFWTFCWKAKSTVGCVVTTFKKHSSFYPKFLCLLATIHQLVSDRPMSDVSSHLTLKLIESLLLMNSLLGSVWNLKQPWKKWRDHSCFDFIQYFCMYCGDSSQVFVEFLIESNLRNVMKSPKSNSNDTKFWKKYIFFFIIPLNIWIFILIYM